MNSYMPLLKDKVVALVVNQTSMVKNKHLVDTLLDLDIRISKIFAPEHGFRGDADAGEKVKDGKDIATGLPIISLYGKNKKPSPEQLAGIDVVIFDIQDVGTRFYTYISTMHYVMEACAEGDIRLLVLDRPNPNGHYVDGPIRAESYASFVAMHPIPVVHGLTIGELACMINEEGWLSDKLYCKLEVINCIGYTHKLFYQLPVKPSPNLPNMHAVYLYPSLCFFEGTSVSVGRGTDYPFQIFGEPFSQIKEYTFTPEPRPGSKQPPQQGVKCYGRDLHNLSITELQKRNKINWSWLIEMYNESTQRDNFFLTNNFIDQLVGNPSLRNSILLKTPFDEWESLWQADLNAYKLLRKKYLLYPDFE